MAAIVKLYHGGEECNTYVLGEKDSPCVVIDPGYNLHGSLDNYIEKHHKTVLGYLVTHGHFDHIQGLITLTHRAPVFMAEKDVACLQDPFLNGSADLKGEELRIEGIQPYPVDDEDEIRLGSYVFKVILTPFHTRGSCCFYLEKEGVLFSGDTLFHLGVGRSDLPGGCPKEMIGSLRKLAALPIATKVYPGHGESTDIKNELVFNPYFSGLRNLKR